LIIFTCFGCFTGLYLRQSKTELIESFSMQQKNKNPRFNISILDALFNIYTYTLNII